MAGFTPSDRAKTVSKLPALELLGLALSEKQIPKIVENTKKCRELLEPLERDGMRLAAIHSEPGSHASNK